MQKVIASTVLSVFLMADAVRKTKPNHPTNLKSNMPHPRRPLLKSGIT